VGTNASVEGNYNQYGFGRGGDGGVGGLFGGAGGAGGTASANPGKNGAGSFGSVAIAGYGGNGGGATAAGGVGGYALSKYVLDINDGPLNLLSGAFTAAAAMARAIRQPLGSASNK
jgi:hypothetical protein